jgi:hypothetical protein
MEYVGQTSRSMRDGPLLETSDDGIWLLVLPQGLSAQTDPVESTGNPGVESALRRRRSIAILGPVSSRSM